MSEKPLIKISRRGQMDLSEPIHIDSKNRVFDTFVVHASTSSCSSSFSQATINEIEDYSKYRSVHVVRHLAAITIQSFYRKYIKWERDEEGLAIDPILKEGIPHERLIRIFYRTLGSSGNIMTRVQYYDIESLWMSITCTHETIAVNPLTNTKFTRDQFIKIIVKAVERGLVERNEVSKIFKTYKHGFKSEQYSSKYEINESVILQQRMIKVHHKLIRLCLSGSTSEFLTLLMKNMDHVESDHLRLDATKSFPEVVAVYGYLHRCTLIQLASATGNYEIMLNLLELGAVLNKSCEGHVYPLHIALFEGHVHLIPLILMYGWKIDLTSPLGTTDSLADALLGEYPDIYRQLYMPYTLYNGSLDSVESNLFSGSSKNKHPVSVQIQLENAELAESLTMAQVYKAP